MRPRKSWCDFTRLWLKDANEDWKLQQPACANIDPWKVDSTGWCADYRGSNAPRLISDVRIDFISAVTEWGTGERGRFFLANNPDVEEEPKKQKTPQNKD